MHILDASMNNGTTTLIYQTSSTAPSYSPDELTARSELIVTRTICFRGGAVFVQSVHEDSEPRFFANMLK